LSYIYYLSKGGKHPRPNLFRPNKEGVTTA
jgi:hypothetical protein